MLYDDNDLLLLGNDYAGWDPRFWQESHCAGAGEGGLPGGQQRQVRWQGEDPQDRQRWIESGQKDRCR